MALHSIAGSCCGWEAIFCAIAPFLGVGPGVMSRVSNLYRPIETGAGLDHIQQLHNTPVQIAGGARAGGPGIFLAGIVLILRSGFGCGGSR
jgi:hypothetical protein